MAKVAILGANGQLGSDLMKVLSKHHDVISVTREFVDAVNINVLEQLQQHAINVDYIVNCVAVTNVDGCEDNSLNAFQINADFAYKVAKHCFVHGIKLFHISTDYVFSGDKDGVYLETDDTNPLNIYGLSKLSGELAVQAYSKECFIFRVSSLFGISGASGKGGNFVTTMQRLAREKDFWTVIDDQITCPTHTLDIARAISTFIDNNVTEYGIYNCVSSNSCSWFQFTQDILMLSGFDVNKVQPISYKNYTFKALRPQNSVMSVDKISKYYQMPTYQEALKEFISLQSI